MTTFSAKQKAIAIAPKFTSFLSMMGSSFIIFHVLFRGRKNTTINRLLLGMSCCDLVVSTCFFLTSWPIPADTPNIYGASGNQATCTAQGFFSQFSIAVVMYNASLSIYYVVKIRYQWRDQRIATKVEPYLHAFAILFAVGTSTAGVLLDLYNNDSWECWIAPLPHGCRESYKHGGETTCIRGDNASLYRWVFYYAPLWCAILFVTVAMVAVYRSVLAAEKAAERYGESQFYTASQWQRKRKKRKHSKRVASQGYWYCGAFYLTWLLPTVTRLTQLIVTPPYALLLLTAMFVPIQGFLNCLVYIHPRYKSLREDVRSSIARFSQSYESSVEMQVASSGGFRHTNVTVSDTNGDGEQNVGLEGRREEIDVEE